MRNDPKGLAKAIKAFVEATPESRGFPTVLSWYSSPVAERGKQSEDEE
jgi:hypothetical protein